jgi:hypothetical protein
MPIPAIVGMSEQSTPELRESVWESFVVYVQRAFSADETKFRKLTPA